MSGPDFARMVATLTPENKALLLRVMTMLHDAAGFTEAWSAEEERLGRPPSPAEAIQLKDAWERRRCPMRNKKRPAVS